MLGTIRLDDWQEGPPGSGQGGLTAYRFCAVVGQELSVRFHAPIPIGIDLVVDRDDATGGYTLTDEANETLILSGHPHRFDSPPPASLTVAEAEAARRRAATMTDLPRLPTCFSCGVERESMGVHPGPLADGRFATDLTPPDWALAADGTVEPWAFWAALDCSAGLMMAAGPDGRVAVTGNYQLKMHQSAVVPGTFAVVAVPVDDGWDGRKRRAASAAFDAAGNLVAQATSLWISIG